jgi:UDP-N-acetylmuramoylalanine--D-glutamate ligase
MLSASGLKARACGNVGHPFTLAAREPWDVLAVEASSFQLYHVDRFHPRVSVLLNLAPDHLDWHGSMDAYAAAKARIFDRCGVAVINLDDPLVAAMARPGQRTASFSLHADRGADYCVRSVAGADWLCHHDEQLLAVDSMRIVGSHNAANALAALALGDALGLARPAMVDALRDFPGLPHRGAWVADIAGVRYVDDSKGTNVGATLAAVSGFKGPLLLIAGGDGKNQDFSPLRAAFTGKVRQALLIGRDAPRIEAALQGVCATERCATLEAAVIAASRIARAGDTVLLSPACASLDMFRDYAHRGQTFAEAVRRLAA